MKLISMGAVMALTLALAACAKPPLETKKTGNSEVDLGLLFEHDGCKVYRFSDAGHYVYFTNCQGSMQSSYTRYCGKGCVQDVPVRVATTVKEGAFQ